MTLGKPRFTRLDAVLILIALLAVVPRLILGATQFIEYDGYWHVFVAQQDNWQQFLREVRANYHPPLFYLLLKAMLWFGSTHLVYRAVSLATGVLAVYVVGKIAQKVSLGPYTPAAAALMYGLALPGIIISCEVRSYMLSELFVLLSLYYFLDVLSPEAAIKSRVLFALGAVLAGYSHYYAFFYVLACAVVTAVFDVFWMRRRTLRRLALDTAMFAAVGLPLAYLYYKHARWHAGIAAHLRTFYFQPGGGESLTHFLLRTTRHLFNLFSPFPVDSASLFVAVLALLVLGAGWLVYLIRRQRLPENAGAAAVLLTTVVIFAGILAGGLAGKYPFGGDLRQQFILFPLAVLCGCILLDRISAEIHNRTTAMAVVAILVALVVAGWVRAFWLFPKIRTEIATSAMRRFDKNFPAPQAVFVDQFNLINFFIHHHAWKWRLVKHDLARTGVDVYQLSRGRGHLLLLRNPNLWNMDFDSPALYWQLDKCMRAQSLPSLTIFYTRQAASAPMQPDWRIARGIIGRAASQSLCVKKLAVEGAAVYGEFREGRCETEMNAMTNCRQCDDTNWSIAYTGNWQRGDYDGALEATLTYTEQAGATAVLSFEGSEVTYVYTKAYNRGFAAIAIDGESKGLLDLYSPRIEWQTRTTYGGLRKGRHTIEIRATGQHRPGSKGDAIDVDALLVR